MDAIYKPYTHVQGHCCWKTLPNFFQFYFGSVFLTFETYTSHPFPCQFDHVPPPSYCWPIRDFHYNTNGRHYGKTNERLLYQHNNCHAKYHNSVFFLGLHPNDPSLHLVSIYSIHLSYGFCLVEHIPPCH